MTARIGFNALLATLPSSEDTPFKGTARRIAAHLFAAANVPAHINDPALLPGVTESDTHLSGAESLTRSNRLIRTGVGVAAFAAAAAVMIPATVEAIGHTEERMVQIYEQNNSAELPYPAIGEQDPAAEYRYVQPFNAQAQPGK